MRSQSVSLYSILLVVIGVGGYFLSGQASYTALIPAVFGALIYGGNALNARSEGKVWLIVTGVLALLGLGGTARGLGSFFGGIASGGLTMASASQTLTFILCALVLAAVVQMWRGSEPTSAS